MFQVILYDTLSLMPPALQNDSGTFKFPFQEYVPFSALTPSPFVFPTAQRTVWFELGADWLHDSSESVSAYTRTGKQQLSTSWQHLSTYDLLFAIHVYYNTDSPFVCCVTVTPPPSVRESEVISYLKDMSDDLIHFA